MAGTEMKVSEYLETLVNDFPLCEFAFGDPSMIGFSDKVFTICETDCERYQHCWACPPHAGKIEDNMNRIHGYHRFFLFSTVWDVEDAWDKQGCLEVKRNHEEISRAIRERVLNEFHLPMESIEENPNPDIYMLSTGCAICDKCACPEEGCRHPEQRLMSMESHGILIVKLVEDCGLTAVYDGKTIVYFTIILYKEDKNE